MTFNPQIPSWGKDFSENYINELLSYHSWLSTTGIKTGLISPKNNMHFHDLYYKLSFLKHYLISIRLSILSQICTA